MAITIPFREWQLPPAHSHPRAGMRLPLPPFLAAHPLRQHWIWRGPSCGEVRRRAEPPPLRGRERPSILTGPSSARLPRGRPAGSIPSPPFPASPGPPPGPVRQAGLPPPHPPRLAGLIPGARFFGGDRNTPRLRRARGDAARPQRGSRGAPRPEAARPVPPRGLRTHPRRSGSSRS